MFKGRRTKIFWLGLIFCALSACILFAILWYWYVMTWFPLGISMPFIFGSVVFLLIRLHMIISGVEKGERSK